MSRIQSVRANWTEITERLRSDKQELAQFLRFSAGMYKQSFPDAALIYHQNPNATKVTTLETWNKLGRLVNKGERSIAVFGEDSKCRYLFDVTQTNGKRLPELWKLNEDLSSELTAVINEKYGKDCKNIQETIAAMTVDNMKPYLPDMQYAAEQMRLSERDIKTYQQSMVSAVRFVVSNRCELGSDMKISGGINLNAADLFRNNRDLIRFCDMVQKSAKDTLLEMEREIVQILRKRREKTYDLQTQSNRTLESRNTVHGQPQRTENAGEANRQMGQNVAGMDENRVSDRGERTHNGGSLEHNSERNRRRRVETLSGAGRTVSTAEPTSADVQRNSAVGENKNTDNRTSADERGGIQSENAVAQKLIDRFLHADFNRRLDSYETAGMVFSDTKDTHFNPVDFFNKFHSDRFSDMQAEEIRSIIKAAMESREYVPEPVIEEEPVIIHNEVVETTELPPLLDENIINGIMKHDEFFKVKRNEIAEFFKGNEDYDKRCEFMKSVFCMDEYTEFNLNETNEGYDRVGCKAESDGLIVWEGSYLSRTKESKLSWDLVQSFTAALIDNGKYLDEKPQLMVDEPIFAEPTKEYSQGEQLTFFGEPVPVGQSEKKTRAKSKPTNIAVSHTAPTTDMVNHVLRGGSDEPRSLERIVAQFQKGKSVAENAEFLRKEFGESGRGYKYSSPDFSSSALVESWADNTGITVAISNTAFPEGKKAHLEWDEVAERIGEMLENGEYCSQDIIDRAADNEIKDIADKLWYLHQDCEVEYFIPDEMFKGGFPDSTERIKASLTDSETLQKYVDGLEDLVNQYEQDRDVLRFHFHKPRELLSRLKDLQLQRRDFITKSDFSYEPKFFVTEDEKDKLLTGGSGVQYGKFRIEKFFKEEHTEKEKIAFLKKEYGDGGQGRSGFNEWHDAKGISYKKGSLSTPDCEAFMKWNEVAQRIDRLISEGRYVTQRDIDNRINDAKRTLKTRTPNDDYDKAVIEQAKKVLKEYGISPDEETKQSPLEKIIAKAEAEGIPIEITDEPAKERAVYMDNRD